MPDVVISAEQLTVRFGSLEAVRDVDVTVRAGEVVALLGPNGAGKTTCVETLLGFRRPDAGRARVLGSDPVSEHRVLVERLGAMLQDGGSWPSLPAGEALRLVASYYGRPVPPDELIELLDLARCARTPWRRLSGGERQRLSLAMALLGRPEALFLDEPTAGVDPIGRRVIREVIAQQRADGTAVLLCTHDLADVEATCDAAVIIQHGTVRASGLVASLTAGGTSFEAAASLDLTALARVVGAPVLEPRPGAYRTDAVLDATAMSALVVHLATHGSTLTAMRSGTSLEDRYVELVGEPVTDARDEPRSRRR